MALGAAAVLFMVGYMVLPGLLEPVITETVSARLGLDRFSFRIGKIGLSESVFTDIRSGENLEIDVARVVYSPSGLFEKKQVSGVAVSGLRVIMSRDGKKKIIVKDLEKVLHKLSSRPKDDPRQPLPLPGRVEVRQAQIILQDGGRRVMTLPFSCRFDITQSGQDIQVKGRIYPVNETIDLTVQWNLLTQISLIEITADGLDISRLLQVIPVDMADVRLSGRSDIRLTVRNVKTARLAVSAVHVQTPAAVEFYDISQDLALESGKLTSAGRFHVGCRNVRIGLDTRLKMDFAHPERSVLNVDSISGPEVGIESAFGRISSEKVNVRLAANGSMKKGSAELKLSAARVVTSSERFSQSAKNADATLYLDYEHTGTGMGIKGTAHVQAEDLDVTSPELKAGIDSIRVSGNLSVFPGEPPDGHVDAWITGGSFSMTGYPVSIDGASVYVPLDYPFETNQDQGRVEVPHWSLSPAGGPAVTGRMEGFVRQTRTGINAGGEVSVDALESFSAGFDLDAGLDETSGPFIRLTSRTRPFGFTQDNLAGFIPKPFEDIRFTVNAVSTAMVTLRNRQIRSDARVDISRSDVHWPRNRLTLTGITTQIHIKDLVNMYSEPAQIMTVDTIKVNDIAAENAQIAYTIEGADTVLVENMSVQWCNGRVSSEAFRLPPDRKKRALFTLYCDRLELTELLRQVGAFQAQGSGSLNGRIPVAYQDGIISFDNGFLFSTPGIGGRILVENTDRLIAGIPPDTVQYAQLDLAREALKDYDYRWAKLLFNSQDDVLVLNLQFDGQPSNPVLPFEFRKDLGAFTRVDSNSPGSKFQGIKLDVNVKIPFNQFLKFGNQLNEFVK